ncbi:Beta-ketoacyl synthase protein [Dirofilaria immitis]|nr:Beta-ketoacyl synthase protein [Dirofilaria immitis]
MKEEKYLFDHLIHNYNILSAATLLIIIYDALSKKVNILNDVTFLFPITFTSENEIINFQIQISTNALCTLTYANLQCVTFQVGECCLEMHSECDNNNWQCQNIHRDITIANTGSEQNLKSISKREFYTLMEQYHYQYCQEFRCIENLIINGENGTVELKPTEHLDILIDGAMQAIVFIYIQQYGIKLSTLVPFHIQKMKIVDIANEAIPIGKHNNTNILAFVKIELQNERFWDEKIVCIKSFACRLPKNIHNPAEFWDALKTGQIMASKIPCSRISGRDSLAQGQYGHPVSIFDISRSEAEKIDPQQRILLECVYECMENAGLTSLKDTGFFIGFMSNEYPDIAKSRDAISMLGSSASIVSGRLNYLFGSTGPSITLDTACSSSLVALQAAIHALFAGQCTMAIVAGVNLILTEQSIGQRANGNLLSDDGICRSFDARSSGYGRADGCVALLLTITDKMIESDNDSALLSIISTCIGHNGQGMALTVPNGCAQEKLLRECLSKLTSSQSVNYWEAHGTGTIIGDAIELKALQANLQQCLIGTVKTNFGHSEAAAGATGLAKILLQFKYEYIPQHGSYQFLQNLQNGNLYLPIIGEEWNDTLAGISSFGKLKFAEINDIAYLNMQIFTNKISTTNNYADKYKWYKLCTIKDWNIFEYELMKMIATFYLQGKCINWAHLYSLPSQLITLPNYQFKHESYWITENQQSTIDHWLIGRLLEEEEDRCIFINQISKMTNAELMNFKYDGQIRFTFGICCEAIIQAFQLTFSKNIIDESQYYSIKNITMIKYIVQENDWIKITITKYADKRYHAKITCTSDIICEAKIKLIASIATMKATNIIETENFNTKTNFYEILNDKGLSYEGIYQTIINASSNEKIFNDNQCNFGQQESSKKVDKMKYRKKVDEAKLDQFINSSSIAYQQYIDKIRQAVEDIRKDDNAISNEQLSTSFAELGLDSLAITDLANRLNTNYFPGLRITAVDLFNYSNIRLLTDAIYTHKISSIITDNKDEEMSRIMEERSDVINTTLKQYTNREFQNHDTYKYIRGRSGSQDSISMINEDESCAYSQIFLMSSNQ